MKFAKMCNIEAVRENSNVSNFAVKSLDIEKTEIAMKSQPDARAAYKRLREIQHQELIEKSTISDVKFDKEFCENHPGLKEKCTALLQKYSNVTQSDTGWLSPQKWAVNAVISGKCLKPNPRQSIRKYSAQENVAIIKKWSKITRMGYKFFQRIIKFPPVTYLTF
jgi:hypothetical protein